MLQRHGHLSTRLAIYANASAIVHSLKPQDLHYINRVYCLSQECMAMSIFEKYYFVILFYNPHKKPSNVYIASGHGRHVIIIELSVSGYFFTITEFLALSIT